MDANWKDLVPPPLDSVNQTLAQVDRFVKWDATKKLKYEKGCNCVTSLGR